MYLKHNKNASMKGEYNCKLIFQKIAFLTMFIS